MTAATIDPVDHPTHIDTIAALLPLGTRHALLKVVELLNQTSVPVDDLVGATVGMGEALIARGLDATIETLERVVEYLYDSGLMSRLGLLNSFLRDGAEMGIQVGLNTLKAMEPADVAKLTALLIVVIATPNLLVVNGATYLALASELLGKLWNLS